MREENSVYRGVFRTLLRILQEEGHSGLYRGLGVQLARAIPNSAVMMAVYEIVVHKLSPARDNLSDTDDQDY